MHAVETDIAEDCLEYIYSPNQKNLSFAYF
jgi:hypothetical protein